MLGLSRRGEETHMQLGLRERKGEECLFQCLFNSQNVVSRKPKRAERREPEGVLKDSSIEVYRRLVELHCGRKKRGGG